MSNRSLIFYAGSNAAVSAVLVWLCVQKFVQSSSVSATAISSENLVAAQVAETAESEMIYPLADSTEQPVQDNQKILSDTKSEDGAHGEQLIASDAGDS
jgi:hypothetical protein